MSTQLATAPNPPDSLSLLHGVQRFLVKRRITISLVLFTALVSIDLWILRLKPRDVLQVADPLVAAGLALVVAGLLVRSWAAGTLHKNQQLTMTGPYSLVRNPLYFGSFLMMGGFCLLLNDPHTLWVVIGPVALIYILVVRYEERTLLRCFPETFPAYRARVPAIIPWRMNLQLGGWSLAQWLANREYNAWVGSLVAIGGLYAWRVWG
ncbi:MAG: isoprenylcysteine carboxylmethyltransferase family protein [Pirellulaceae bacterium]|nr:isoprenylcysteine carboxylmethyltransferase family protein [Pirellulaceae bacterium]